MLFLSGLRAAAVVENDADRPGRREGEHDTANGHEGAVRAGREQFQSDVRDQ